MNLIPHGWKSRPCLLGMKKTPELLSCNDGVPGFWSYQKFALKATKGCHPPFCWSPAPSIIIQFSIHWWEKLSQCSIDGSSNMKKNLAGHIENLQKTPSSKRIWLSELGLDVSWNASIQIQYMNICVTIEFALHMHSKRRHWLQIYSPMYLSFTSICKIPMFVNSFRTSSMLVDYHIQLHDFSLLVCPEMKSHLSEKQINPMPCRQKNVCFDQVLYSKT